MLTGGGETDDERSARQKCQKYACDIQDCLVKNNYQNNRCKNVIDDYHKCMAKYIPEKYQKKVY